MARQSAWNPMKQLQKGVTFVHYTKDLACPFSPTPEDTRKLFECDSHKLVLLYSKETTYGKQGHNYGHEYLALAKLENGLHEVTQPECRLKLETHKSP